ncbi:MAG: hypothetical protein NVS3B26_15610 [Mycobacteriales bacterium]
MTTHTVPADVEPASITDLVDDCREVSGMLAPFVIDLTNIPAPRSALPFLIPPQTAAALEGFEEYGS